MAVPTSHAAPKPPIDKAADFHVRDDDGGTEAFEEQMLLVETAPDRARSKSRGILRIIICDTEPQRKQKQKPGRVVQFSGDGSPNSRLMICKPLLSGSVKLFQVTGSLSDVLGLQFECRQDPLLLKTLSLDRPARTDNDAKIRFKVTHRCNRWGDVKSGFFHYGDARVRFSARKDSFPAICLRDAVDSGLPRYVPLALHVIIEEYLGFGGGTWIIELDDAAESYSHELEACVKW
jgi:hypothetical protein